MTQDNSKNVAPNTGADRLVSLTDTGSYIKITDMKYRNKVNNCRKLDKDHYRDANGIVHEYKHTENRQQSIKSVRRSLNKLCDIINANTTDLSRCRWVTLTYADNMTDLAQLAKDWGIFLKKARRKWGKFEYIAVKEPQARGAWHLHVIMIFEGNAPRIANDDLFKMWGKGYVKVKGMTEGVDFGLYFTASLRDLTKSEAEKAGIVTADRKVSADKKYIKGARLELYPRNMRIFEHSQNINKPKKETMTKSQANQRVKDMKKVSQYTTFPKDVAGRYLNNITITKYKKEE